jgi:hypothetical protein
MQREVIPGMDKNGYMDNRKYPIDPLTGETVLTLEAYKTLTLQQQAEEEGKKQKSKWKFTGIQARAYGDCYPGDPPRGPQLDEYDYINEYIPPVPKIMPGRRDFDIRPGARGVAKSPLAAPPDMFVVSSLTKDYSHTEMEEPVGYYPARRAESILSWNKNSKVKFNHFPETHVPKFRHPLPNFETTGMRWNRTFLSPVKNKLGAKKIGADSWESEKVNPRMYEVAENVGGERKQDFFKHELARRARKKETTTKPHVSYG